MKTAKFDKMQSLMKTIKIHVNELSEQNKDLHQELTNVNDAKSML